MGILLGGRQTVYTINVIANKYVCKYSFDVEQTPKFLLKPHFTYTAGMFCGKVTSFITYS